MTEQPIRYRVIEARFVPGEWCVEILREDGGYKAVSFFRGAEARERAIDYARDRFGEFDETLKPTTGTVTSERKARTITRPSATKQTA